MFGGSNESRLAVARVVVIEGINLSKTNAKQPNVYCSLRLGKQKKSSKVVSKFRHPVWRETFEFYLYEGSNHQLEIKIKNQASRKDKFNKDEIGQVNLDFSKLKHDSTTDIWEEIHPNGSGKLHLSVTISGTTAHDSTSNIDSISDLDAVKSKWIDQLKVFNSSLTSSCVGKLLVTVYKAEGLAAVDLKGKSDPFCEIGVNNDALWTQTMYKTLNPGWDKRFEFSIKDICDCVEVNIYDEENDGKHRILGRLKIPLLQIRNNEPIWYSLKDKTLRLQARGDDPKILLEFFLAYNPIQAAFNTFKPRQNKYQEKGLEEEKFDRKEITKSIARIQFLTSDLDTDKIKSQLNSILNWENKLKTIFVLFGYVLLVYIFQPWMITFLLLLVFLKNSGGSLSSIIWNRRNSRDQEHPITNPDDYLALINDADDDDEYIVGADEKKERTSIMGAFYRIQDISVKVQTVLERLVNLSESTRNIVLFKVPFLSWIVVAILIPVNMILYFVPIRHIVMVAGVCKLLKGLIKDNSLGAGSSNRMKNFISKVPDNEELKDWDVESKLSLESNDVSLQSKPKSVKNYIPKMLAKRNADVKDKSYPTEASSSTNDKSINESNTMPNVDDCNEKLQATTEVCIKWPSCDTQNTRVADGMKSSPEKVEPSDLSLESKPKVKNYIPKMLSKRIPDIKDKLYPTEASGKADDSSTNKSNRNSNFDDRDEELPVTTDMYSESSSDDTKSMNVDATIETTVDTVEIRSITAMHDHGHDQNDNNFGETQIEPQIEVAQAPSRFAKLEVKHLKGYNFIPKMSENASSFNNQLRIKRDVLMDQIKAKSKLLTKHEAEDVYDADASSNDDSSQQRSPGIRRRDILLAKVTGKGNLN